MAVHPKISGVLLPPLTLLDKFPADRLPRFRSVSHKPVCSQISLIALLSFCCALPALQNVLLVTVSLSLLGRCGGNMYIDRVLEYINKVQQGTKRSAHAASFGRALDMTTLLRAILRACRDGCQHRGDAQDVQKGDCRPHGQVCGGEALRARG